jgi:hypothetical protein
MLSFFKKAPARRAEIRKNRPDTPARRWEIMKTSGLPVSIAIAALFFVAATAILMFREEAVPYRPGQYATHDIVSRVTFSFKDKDQLAAVQRAARDATPRVYRANGDVWQKLQDELLALPDRVVAAPSPEVLGEDLRGVLDSSSYTRLKELAAGPARQKYVQQIESFIRAVQWVDPAKPETGLYIIPANEKQREQALRKDMVVLRSADDSTAVQLRSEMLHTPEMRSALEARLAQRAKETIEFPLQGKIVAITLRSLQPTHVFDEAATTEAQNRAEAAVPASAGDIEFEKNYPLVKQGEEIDDRDWQAMKAENQAFNRSLDQRAWKGRAGIAGTVLILTLVLSAYVAMFQPKVIRKHARAIAIVALLLLMLLMAQLAGIGSNPIHVFAVAPTILVAMILAIAYDRRFAIGVALIHAVLVTIGVGEGLPFFLILLAGVATCCSLLDDIRSRSKLIEVGGATALAMMAATAAAGAMALDPLVYIGKNCLYTGAAGLAVGFIVLGILPFIEKSFRITTSMTLLELADASHPLLRRLAVEAPGTYNHSLQVATIAEAAAEAIGANSLLCRVASYYHDVGKINKADYFIENQLGGENRHLNLSPSVSLLIIIGHVKDGIELAREYNLPTSLFPFIQQHHGTTLVEYFYHRACNRTEQKQPDAPAISEVQYRYPGPKPRTKEIAIVMISDAAESATRAMNEPNAPRIEQLVQDLVMKRLLDGQFDDCDLTMRDLEKVQRACVKILLGIYHGRIAYPSNAAAQAAPSAPAVAAKTA